MFNIRRNKKGFTLVELIVVIAILAILAGTAAGIGVTLINKNTNKTAQSEADNLVNDFKLFMQDKQSDDTFNIDSYTNAAGVIAAIFTHEGDGFIASLDEDKQQEGKLKEGGVLTTAVPSDKGSLPKAGSHEFNAYVEYTPGDDDTATVFTVTFVCAVKGAIPFGSGELTSGGKLIVAVYKYANLVG